MLHILYILSKIFLEVFSRKFWNVALGVWMHWGMGNLNAAYHGTKSEWIPIGIIQLFSRFLLYFLGKTK